MATIQWTAVGGILPDQAFKQQQAGTLEVEHICPFCQCSNNTRSPMKRCKGCLRKWKRVGVLTVLYQRETDF